MSKLYKLLFISFFIISSYQQTFAGRYYDSEVGRFLSVDPLADKAPGWSPYNYCFNNPLKFTDPDGKFPVLAVWAIIEVGLAVYDAYETYTTLTDKTATTTDKIATTTGALLGAVLPGGGYSKTDDIAKGGLKLIGSTGDAASTGLKNWQKFENLAKSGFSIGDKKFSINKHVINSLKKSGRKDIDPESLLRALKEEAKEGITHPEKGKSFIYTDPKTGNKFFINESNEIIGVHPANFK